MVEKWKKFQGDLFNSGQSQINFSKQYKKNQNWVFETRGLVWSSPIIDEEDNQ